MLSVIAVNTMTRKLRLFIWGRGIIAQVQVDSLAVTHLLEENPIRLVWIFILIVETIRLAMPIRVGIATLNTQMKKERQRECQWIVRLMFGYLMNENQAKQRPLKLKLLLLQRKFRLLQRHNNTKIDHNLYYNTNNGTILCFSKKEHGYFFTN